MCLLVYLLCITFWYTMRPKSKFLAAGMKRSKSTTNAKVIFKAYQGNTTRIILLLIHHFCSAIHFPFSQFKIHKISQCGRFQLFLVIQFVHNCCTLQIHILNTEAGTKPCCVHYGFSSCLEFQRFTWKSLPHGRWYRILLNLWGENACTRGK